MPGLHDLIQLVISNIWIYGGSFLLVLGILVFVHEFGHYAVARLCGVRIDTFSIGFGKEIWGFNDRHGTRWKLSAVPLGGYVKMFGDVDPTSSKQDENVHGANGDVRPMTAEERNVAFFAKPVWQRAAIVFAGPAINYIFALAVLAGLFMTYGQVVTPPLASAVVQGSAADKAGFKPQDLILSIDGDKITKFEELRLAVTVKLDKPTVFTVKRGDKILNLTASPTKVVDTDNHGFKQSHGVLGVISAGSGNGLEFKSIKAVDGTPVSDPDTLRKMLLARMDTTFTASLELSDKSVNTVLIHPLSARNQGLLDPKSKGYNGLVIASTDKDPVVKRTPAQAVAEAGKEVYTYTAMTLKSIGQMFTGQRSAKELGGIIRIGAIAGDTAKMGLTSLVVFAAMLSINLGLINLFPIPLLDGGHLLFYSVEAVRGAPLSDQIQEYAFRLGLAIVVGIMIFANLNDIMQLIL